MRFWQEVDGALVRLAASKADKVRDALANSINAQQVADDFLRAHPADTKITSAQARDWARLHVTAKTLPLLSAIREAYAEAYALGTDAAVAAYAHARLSKAATPSSDDLRASLQFDWSKWKPGNRAASLLLSPPSGLKGLLSNAGQTIKGMTDTSLNRVGTILGDALARGKGSDAAARTLITDGINGMLTSASRAQTIAVTEMARATQIAQMDNYKSFGVEYVEWVDIDADDDCATNAEQGPIPIGETFDSGDTEPPAHPNCRCAIVPAFPDDAELPPLDETPSETPEEPTDHSDAIAQGLEALATELHPDMAVETTAEIAAEVPRVDLPEVWPWDKKNFVAAYGNKPGFVDKFMKVREQVLGIKMSDTGAKFKMLEQPETFKQVVRNTNPQFDPSKSAYSTNCVRAVNAAEMRMRGYDVTATSRPTGIFKNDGSQARDYYGKAWVNPETGKSAWDERISISSVQETELVDKQILEAYPEGARGFISQMWQDSKGEGHVYSWKIVNGEVRYFDPQTGAILDKKFSPETYYLTRGHSFNVLRIDDKEPQAPILQYLKGWK